MKTAAKARAMTNGARANSIDDTFVAGQPLAFRGGRRRVHLRLVDRADEGDLLPRSLLQSSGTPEYRRRWNLDANRGVDSGGVIVLLQASAYLSGVDSNYRVISVA